MASGKYEPIGAGQVMPITGRMPAGIAEVSTLVSLNCETLERLEHCLVMVDKLQAQPQYPNPPGDTTPIVGGAIYTANMIREYATKLEISIADICKIIGQL